MITYYYDLYHQRFYSFDKEVKEYDRNFIFLEGRFEHIKDVLRKRYGEITFIEGDAEKDFPQYDFQNPRHKKGE